MQEEVTLMNSRKEQIKEKIKEMEADIRETASDLDDAEPDRWRDVEAERLAAGWPWW
jgi:hypothetical protein